MDHYIRSVSSGNPIKERPRPSATEINVDFHLVSAEADAVPEQDLCSLCSAYKQAERLLFSDYCDMKQMSLGKAIYKSSPLKSLLLGWIIIWELILSLNFLI